MCQESGLLRSQLLTHRPGPVQAQHYDFHRHGADGREGVDETGFVLLLLLLLLLGHVGLR